MQNSENMAFHNSLSHFGTWHLQKPTQESSHFTATASAETSATQRMWGWFHNGPFNDSFIFFIMFKSERSL